MEKDPKNAADFLCEPCNFKCCKLSNWSKHIATRKHLDIKQKGPEKCQKFVCEKCDVTCFKLSKWNRHISTIKHQICDKRPEKCQTIFACSKCKKEYKSETSKLRHENKCTLVYAGIIERLLVDNQRIVSDNNELRNFIMDQSKVTADTIAKTIETIMIQNNETMSKAIECCKPNNTTINNNNNQKFNINVFLNDQCKDAINFSDFIKNIEISRQDLENNAQLGFVSGISKIFLDNLKQLGVNERPFHCTDTKRETMYIKDEDKWHKEVDDSKLQKAIQTVSYRSMGKLQEWKKENPEEYQDVNSEFSEKCLSIHKHTIAGSNREVYYPKVIHVLARETMVDK